MTARGPRDSSVSAHHPSARVASGSPAAVRRLGAAALAAAMLAVLAPAAQASTPDVVATGAPAPLATQGPAATTVVERALPSAVDLTEGMTVDSATTFTVSMDDSPGVHVEYVATITNTTPDTWSGGSRVQWYFTELWVPILDGATHLRASRAGGSSLGVRVEEEDGYLPAAAVLLSPRLYYGDTQTVTVTYDLPSSAPRSGSFVQVNEAFASFPVYTTGDPGLADVTVVMPSDADEELVGASMECVHDVSLTTCTATDIADPDQWFAMVVARDDEALVEEVLQVGEKEVHVYAWPGDSAWLDFATDAVARGLPALETAFGRPWGARPRLDIVETSTPYLYGYAGWYQLDNSLIEMGDELDLQVALHEMSHAWLNGETFSSRWITEGLANEYAAQAMAELGVDAPEPSRVDALSEVARPLSDWGVPSPADPLSGATEAYGYNASWWIAHALVEEIGADAMSAVVRAGADSLTPYPAPTTDDRLPSTPGWHTYLDLLENVGGSEQAEELFRALVVADSDQDLLDRRASAREAYAELLEAGDGWAPPAVVRDAMTHWQFSDALALTAEAQVVLDQRDAVAAELARVGAQLPDGLQHDVESATDMSAIQSWLAEALDASGAYVEAVQAEADASVLTRVGLLVAPVATDREAADQALAQGEWPTLRDASLAVQDGLATAGRTAGLGLGLLFALLVGGAALVIWRRRRAAALPPAFTVPAGYPGPQPGAVPVGAYAAAGPAAGPTPSSPYQPYQPQPPAPVPPGPYQPQYAPQPYQPQQYAPQPFQPQQYAPRPQPPAAVPPEPYQPQSYEPAPQPPGEETSPPQGWFDPR